MSWYLIALSIYFAPAIAAIAVWVAAPGKRRLLALLAVAFVIAASIPGWTTTPDGVLRDTLEYGPNWSGSLPVWTAWNTWNAMFAHIYWTTAPIGVLHKLTGTWLVERALGLCWHCLLAATFCALSVVPLASVPIVLAITSATRFGLWIQRHHLGSEILLQQLLLIVCLYRAREGSRWWVIGAIALLIPLQYTYPAAKMTLVYPLVLLGLTWRAVILTACTVAACAFQLITIGSPELGGPWWSQYASQFHPTHLWVLFAAFWDERYSQDVSWLWSYPGAQHLPAVACALVLLGVACAVWSVDGWRWIALAILGLTPALFSDTMRAASHREMMALVPLAVLAAWPLRLLSQRWQWRYSIPLAALIAVYGLREWHDPAFWQVWKAVGWHGF